MNYRVLLVILSLIIAIFIIGCEKVITLDLNNAQPVMVIYGVVTDSAGPYIVTLSKSSSYFNPPVSNPVSGATVIISDNAGNTDTLKEATAGKYLTSKLKGVPERTYNLKVISQNQIYKATSTMYSHVNIDSLIIQKSILSGFGFGGKGTTHYNLNCWFRDPFEKNYYRLKTIKNDTVNANIRLYNDQYTNGEETPLSAGRVIGGDTCIIELFSLDQQAYEYYLTLNDILNQSPIFGGTPANPVNNISNGAQGDFSAWAISYTTIIITDSLISQIK